MGTLSLPIFISHSDVYLGDLPADGMQLPAEEGGVNILHFAGQNLVANNDKSDRGRNCARR